MIKTMTKTSSVDTNARPRPGVALLAAPGQIMATLARRCRAVVTSVGTADRAEDAAGGDRDDVMRLWRIVDELTAELSDADCRAVYTAIASGVADGWRPTHTEITNLVAFATQQATAAHHHSFAAVGGHRGGA